MRNQTITAGFCEVMWQQQNAVSTQTFCFLCVSDSNAGKFSGTCQNRYFATACVNRDLNDDAVFG
jgi:hypothetical protein